MAEHLGYDDKHVTKTEDWVMVLGIDKNVDIPHELGASTNIKEAYWMVENSAGTVVVSINLADHAAQFDFTTDNNCELTILDTNTNGLTPGDYKYGFVLVDQGDLKHEPQYGKLTLLDGYVIAQGTAPHETWQTADDRDQEIDDVEAILGTMAIQYDVPISWLDADASASATTITVYDDTIFESGTPTIRIDLDAGTYQDVTASSATANVITLGTPLSGAASKYNVVRLGP